MVGVAVTASGVDVSTGVVGVRGVVGDACDAAVRGRVASIDGSAGVASLVHATVKKPAIKTAIIPVSFIGKDYSIPPPTKS